MNREKHDNGVDIDPFRYDEHLQITRMRADSNYGEFATINLEKYYA